MLSQNGAMMSAELGRRFTFSLSCTLCFAYGHHDLCLLARKIALTGSSATPSDFCEILAHCAWESNSLASHSSIVNGLR